MLRLRRQPRNVVVGDILGVQSQASRTGVEAADGVRQGWVGTGDGLKGPCLDFHWLPDPQHSEFTFSPVRSSGGGSIYAGKQAGGNGGIRTWRKGYVGGALDPSRVDVLCASSGRGPCQNTGGQPTTGGGEAGETKIPILRQNRVLNKYTGRHSARRQTGPGVGRRGGRAVGVACRSPIRPGSTLSPPPLRPTGANPTPIAARRAVN